MELSEQVVSLELAKKLKELGVEQKSLFYWYKFLSGEEFQIQNRIDIKNSLVIKEETYSAFTVAELGEILWDVFEKTDWKLLYKAYGEVFDFKGTSWIGDLGIVNLIRNPNMSAKMLIYLLEKNLIINKAK